MEIATAWLSTFAFESFVQHDNGITAYIPQDQTPENLLEDFLASPFDGVKLSEHALSAATKKDCSFDIVNLSIENPCKEKAID